MSPSDIPWWGWILGGLAGFIAGLALNDDADNVLVKVFGMFLAASGFISIIAGIIRFVKWVWPG